MKMPRARISLRVLIVVVAFSAIPAAREANRLRLQRAAVQAIVRAGGRVYYDDQWDWDNQWVARRPARPARPRGPGWFRALIGDELLREVVYVDLPLAAEGRERLKPVEGLPGLQVLVMLGAPVAERELSSLSGLTALRVLRMPAAQVSDAGLAGLRCLVGLRKLDLNWSPITDAGLEQLGHLQSLDALVVTHTGVTEEGVARLKARRPGLLVVR